MHDEILKMRGRLAEAERLYHEYGISVDADIIKARDLLDPFEDEPAKLKTEQAVLVVNRLHETVNKMRDLRQRIADLKSSLGEK